MGWHKKWEAKRLKALAERMEQAKVQIVKEAEATLERIGNTVQGRTNADEQFKKIKEDLISGLATKKHRVDTSA